MRKEKALEILRANKDQLLALGVASLILFGSVARNQAGPNSDVDLLVEFQGKPSFDRYMDLKFFLEDTLGQPVDLVTKDALKPRLLPYIKKDAIDVT